MSVLSTRQAREIRLGVRTAQQVIGKGRLGPKWAQRHGRFFRSLAADAYYAYYMKHKVRPLLSSLGWGYKW